MEHSFTLEQSVLVVSIIKQPTSLCCGGIPEAKPYKYSFLVDNIPFEVCQMTMFDYVSEGRKFTSEEAAAKPKTPLRSRVRSSSVSVNN